jgi:hypothetical protein
MNISNISTAILAYAESQMLPQISNTFVRWLTYAGLLAKMPQLETMIQQYIPTLKELQIVDDNGNIDLSKIRPIGIAAFEKVPIVKIADFDFDKNDFNNFMNFLGA